MTKLDYGTLLSFEPIIISDVGTLRKPTLKDISAISFVRYNFYLILLQLTPEQYYKELCTEEVIYGFEKDNLYDIILSEESLQDAYMKMFNFFFHETVLFTGDHYLLVDNIDRKDDGEVSFDTIGTIDRESFQNILVLIQQICAVYDEPKEKEEYKYKNQLAKQLHQRMLAAEEEERRRKKVDKDLTYPNIISAVSNRHPSINYLNVWNLTMFQLLDCFKRLQVNCVLDTERISVCIHGDEKNEFDINKWYKNEYDK